jgi:hypothetical protein
VASLAKYICPTAHETDLAAKVPVLTGDVVVEAEKSTAEADPLDRSGPKITIPPLTVSCAYTGVIRSNRSNTVIFQMFLIERCRPSKYVRSQSLSTQYSHTHSWISGELARGDVNK